MLLTLYQLLVQALESSKQQHVNAAFARLEASRLRLLERIKQYSGQGRKLDVLGELNSCFADQNTTFTWKFKEREEKSVETAANHGISGSVIKSIRSLFNPWNWYNTARMAIKLVVVSAIISASIDVYRSRQHYFRSQRKILWPEDREIAGKLECFLKDDSTSRIDVLRGRGWLLYILLISHLFYAQEFDLVTVTCIVIKGSKQKLNWFEPENAWNTNNISWILAVKPSLWAGWVGKLAFNQLRRNRRLM